jgi:hypothetical protein
MSDTPQTPQPSPDEVRARINAALRELGEQRTMLIEVFPLVDAVADALSFISLKKLNDAGLNSEAIDLNRAKNTLDKALKLLEPHR